jgi:hypothetical protein
MWLIVTATFIHAFVCGEQADRAPNGWKAADQISAGSGGGPPSSSSTDSRQFGNWSSSGTEGALQSTKSTSTSSSSTGGGLPQTNTGPATCHHASNSTSSSRMFDHVPLPYPYTARITRTASLDFKSGTQRAHDWSGAADSTGENNVLALLQDREVRCRDWSLIRAPLHPGCC